MSRPIQLAAVGALPTAARRRIPGQVSRVITMRAGLGGSAPIGPLPEPAGPFAGGIFVGPAPPEYQYPPKSTPPTTASVPFVVADAAPPSAVVRRVVAAGAAKAALATEAPFRALLLSVVAGFYLSLGTLLSLQLGDQVGVLSHLASGWGLLLVLTTGGELFSANAALATAATARGVATAGELARSTSLAWLGNLVGAAMLAGAVALTGAAPAAVAAASAWASAVTQTPGTFAALVMRGVLGGACVALGVVQALCTTSFVGKWFGVLMPVAAAGALGFEHAASAGFAWSLAATVGGSAVELSVVVAHLLPVSLGNAAGAALLVGLALVAAQTPGGGTLGAPVGGADGQS